jgi:hypothetical protein
MLPWSTRVNDPRAGRRNVPSLERFSSAGPFSAALGLAIVFSFLLALYLVTGFAPFLVLLTVVAVVGTDRLVRMHPQSRFHGATATVLYLFVPGLFALGAGLALNELDGAVWRFILWAVFSFLFLVTVRMEYLTVDPEAETYELARFVLLFAIYLTALLLFIVVFTMDLSVLLGMVLVGATTFLLTVDILRELEPDSSTLWIQSGAVAAVLAECRAALYFLSLADVLAGAFMLITFYVATGLVQNQMSGRLDRGTWLVYAGVAAVGFLLVVFARLLGS